MTVYISDEVNELSHKVLDAAFAVHAELGPGLLESIYESALAIEFETAGLKFERQKSQPVHYKGKVMDANLRLDFLVADEIVVELKAVEEILPIHEAQLMTYLKLSKKHLGLLLNFNVTGLKQGIKRIVM